MGYFDNISLVNQIKIFTTLKSSKDDEPQFNPNSNLDSSDPLLFLLDLISLILGSAFLRVILSGFLNDLLGSLDKEIKNSLKASNNTETSNTTQSSFNLIIPMSLLDYNDTFKIDPNSIEGKQIYTDGSFNKDFHNNVLNGNNSSSFFGGTIQMSYDQDSNNVSIGQNNINDDKETYLNKTSSNIKIIDVEQINNTLLDSLFNTVSRKKSIKGINTDIELEGIINNILGGKDENESFTIEVGGVEKYEVEAKRIKSGLMVLDFGCDTENLNLDKSFLNQTFENPIIRLESALNEVLNSNSVDSDKSAINDKFNKDASKKLLLNVIKAILLSPQMIIYLLIRQLLLNGNATIPNNAKDFLSSQYGLVRLIICFIRNKFVEYVFKLFKKELLKLVLPVLKEIVKEKLLSYKNILVSLVKK